jgi:hypothetical protein
VHLRILILSIASLGGAACSLVLEPIAHRASDAAGVTDTTSITDAGAADAMAIDVQFRDVATSDVPVNEVISADVPVADAIDTPDPNPDVIVAHDASPPPDGGVPCMADADCVPYWCGCGVCPSATAFTCEHPTQSCLLGCAVEPCPYVQNVSCACVAGFCERTIGSTPAGSPCTIASECEPGLSCCPCGASGCSSSCVPTDPVQGCPTVM